MYVGNVNIDYSLQRRYSADDNDIGLTTWAEITFCSSPTPKVKGLFYARWRQVYLSDLCYCHVIDLLSFNKWVERYV